MSVKCCRCVGISAAFISTRVIVVVFVAAAAAAADSA